MKALPFPLRIALGVLAVIVVIWLARWLGGASILLAACVWAAAALGVLHAAGRLLWVDRFPALSRAFQRYAPRPGGVFTPMSSAATSGRTTASSPPSDVAIPDVSRLVGIDDARHEIDTLVQSRAALKNTVSPATIIVLIGPRGTGKTSMALRMAADLHQVRVVTSSRIVTLSDTELPGLGDTFGLTPETLLSLTERIQLALDGVLLIDDIDRLTSLPGQTTQEVGTRILAVARQFPGRLLVVGTGSPEAFARLDPNRRWLGQLNVRRIAFSDLPDDAMGSVFVDLLASQGFRLAPEAQRALGIRIRELRKEHGDDFDNAHAARRFADAVLHNHAVKLRQRPQSDPAQRIVIAAEEVRNAYSPV